MEICAFWGICDPVYKGLLPVGHSAAIVIVHRLRREGRGPVTCIIMHVTPAMVMCEMLDGETGRALTKEDAKAYAKKHGLVFVEGTEVEELFKKMQN
ncbi:MAG TPA: hypothetical protein V6C97_17080 [Oculatellaceae cyanobacterium]